MWKHVRNLTLIFILLAAGVLWFLSRPDIAQIPEAKMVGKIDKLPDAREQILPTIAIAEVDRWQKGEKPKAAQGLVVSEFTGGLAHPRSMYVLPNGDILVAETNSPKRENKGVEGFVMRYLMGKAGAGEASANRISLLRDADVDGKPEVKTAFLTGLKSPFGMALVNGVLYVANTDAVLAFPYQEGDTKITAKARVVVKLNAKAPNNHWTRNLLASPDGKKLYIAVGSASNIAEHGQDIEQGRARILEHDIATGKVINFGVGLRNPVGMDWSSTGQLWTVVNERDMLGSDLVPDYLAEVSLGDDFGWPHHYWGGYTDFRVKPEMPEKREYEKRPEFALGAHVAPLGVAFANGAVGNKAALGANFASGAFIARHGSWNRKPLSGYDVVFVKFGANGMPLENKLYPVLTGFLDAQDQAQGRPAMVAIAKDGALLVSDDVGNRIWRVTAASMDAGMQSITK